MDNIFLLCPHLIRIVVSLGYIFVPTNQAFISIPRTRAESKSFYADVTFRSMARQCLLEQTLLTLATDAFEWPFIIVFLMVLDRGIPVSDSLKYICTITTPETGAFMLSVPVWNHRSRLFEQLISCLFFCTCFEFCFQWRFTWWGLINLVNSNFFAFRYIPSVIYTKLDRRRWLSSILMRR